MLVLLTVDQLANRQAASRWPHSGWFRTPLLDLYTIRIWRRRSLALAPCSVDLLLSRNARRRRILPVCNYYNETLTPQKNTKNQFKDNFVEDVKIIVFYLSSTTIVTSLKSVFCALRCRTKITSLVTFAQLFPSHRRGRKGIHLKKYFINISSWFCRQHDHAAFPLSVSRHIFRM